MYYKLLGLQKEAFSTSPDPEFFYYSQSHKTALKRLEIQIRLRRGMSLIFGDVGTGKTTLSRILLQQFAEEDDFLFYMILDPGFSDENQFMQHLVHMFGIKADLASPFECRAAIERFLFKKGVEENKTVVLIIDEGQKIAPENLEFLRTLLNYETNEYKLLQLVILSQLELLPRVGQVHNLMDRVALRYMINTLDVEETRLMIDHRLKMAGYLGERSLFKDAAIELIQQETGGYPRKIALLCHEALERAVMNEKFFIDADDIIEIAEERRLLQTKADSLIDNR